ncbi:hypothetical protein ACHHV8_00785 [Paenibacillus sp. TAB 01]|uniref:hypothetical protein n=1 Tax=Paenibacillus sp. TAB 01 TaxID=3368988 RepID=UPI00375002B5
MFRKQYWILFGSVLVFIGLILAAIALQSDLFLYAASGLPLIIFYVLPDIKQHQFIRMNKDRGKVKLVQQNSGDESFMILSFQPDFIRWECSKLYFHLNDILTDVPVASPSSGPIEASIAVLPFDLSAHRRKSGWIGVNLEQLVQRTAKLSYTTDEITRLVIRTQDLESVALDMVAASKPAAVSKSKNKSKSISA